MTRVDFYVLPPGDERQRLVFACRLSEKAYRQGLTVYLRTSEEATARQLDQLLWSFRQGSFVPHALLEESDAAKNPPVLIGVKPIAPDATGLVINIGGEPAEECLRQARVAELVGHDEPSRMAGRARFRHYKALGLSPETHTLSVWPTSGE
jgi:DNA polymerase-3 subunit chi